MARQILDVKVQLDIDDESELRLFHGAIIDLASGLAFMVPDPVEPTVLMEDGDAVRVRFYLEYSAQALAQRSAIKRAFESLVPMAAGVVTTVTVNP